MVLEDGLNKVYMFRKDETFCPPSVIEIGEKPTRKNCAGTDTAKTESKTAQAEALILELLADGRKMPSAELEKAVNDRGISSRTMRTAKSRIGDRLVTEKNGASWICHLRE